MSEPGVTIIGWTADGNGIMRAVLDTTGMRFPVRHVTCGKVHDSGPVEVIARYADCDLWKCPHCGGTCDNRPIGWGGNVERLDRSAAGPTVAP